MLDGLMGLDYTSSRLFVSDKMQLRKGAHLSRLELNHYGAVFDMLRFGLESKTGVFFLLDQGYLTAKQVGEMVEELLFIIRVDSDLEKEPKTSPNTA